MYVLSVTLTILLLAKIFPSAHCSPTAKCSFFSSKYVLNAHDYRKKLYLHACKDHSKLLSQTRED